MTRPLLDALLRAIERDVAGAKEVAMTLRLLADGRLPTTTIAGRHEILTTTADLLEGAADFVWAVALFRIREQSAKAALLYRRSRA